ATGRAQFPRLDGLTRERAALMYVVRRGDDTSFLPLTRSDRGLDLTRFDVGGVQNARIPDQLSAYLFSDRGLYRPGDTIHVAAREGRAMGEEPRRAAAGGRGRRSTRFDGQAREARAGR